MDFLQLSRADNDICMSYIVQLLLGQYREPYNFIKRWATTVQDDDYDFDTTELPFLDIHGADITAALPDLKSEVFFASSIVTIKMMLTKGIRETTNAHELADRESLPAVMVELQRDSKDLAKNLDELKQLHEKLSTQMHQALTLSISFWDAMLNPNPIIQMPMTVSTQMMATCTLIISS